MHFCFSLPLPDEKMDIKLHSLGIHMTKEVDKHTVPYLLLHNFVSNINPYSISTSTDTFGPPGIGLILLS